MSGSTRQSKELKRWLLARRAQFRLQQQFDYLDFVEDVLQPETEAILSGRVRVEIEAGNGEEAKSIIQVSVEPTE